MDTVELRPYQQEMVDGARAAYVRGYRRILLVAPTGAGKTHVLAANAASSVQRTGGPVLYVAHRRQLVEQTHALLTRLGINATILMAGYETDWKAPVFVASRDTIWRRREWIGLDKFRLIIFDEAHIGLDAQRRIAERWADGDTAILGYTATPITLAGPQPGDFYETLIQGPTYRELIAMGYLVPGMYYEGVPVDTSGLRVSKTTNDYVPEDVEKLVRGQVVGNIYEVLMVMADGKRTIVFLPSVPTAWKVAEDLGQWGIPAAVVDWSTPPKERRRILAGFREGKIRVLTNVDVFSEGWDEPFVEAVVLASPTRSTARYLQRVGRGMRPAPGKSHVMVIDMAGQVAEHGIAEGYEEWPLLKRAALLDRKRPSAGLKIKKPLVCPTCRIYFENRGDCPRCGWRPIPEPPREDLEVIPGRFTAVNASVANPIFRKQLWLQEMLGLCLERGWKRGFAYHAYLFRWKEEPPPKWWGLEPMPPSPALKRWAFWYIGYRRSWGGNRNARAQA